MAANKPVWGIDLGQCALKAIRLRTVEGKVEAVDHVYIEHGKILSQPGADRPALVAEAMKKFVEQHDLSKEILVVGVPGQHTLARFTKLPPVDKKKIPEIVKYEAQQQIPFDMEEVIWDYQVFEDPQVMETAVGIFAMRRDLLRDHLHALSSLNLEPAAVQSAPLSLFNALKFDGLCGDEPVCILDIGAQNTDLIVVDGDSLWTRNIPIGGNNFTEALLKTFKLSFRKAERLKRDAQKHKYARQIFQAMRPAFADLVAEVQRSIGFFTSSRRGVKLSKIIAMGNAFKLPGMVKFIQQNLGMEVVRPTTFSKLSASEAANAPQLIDQLLSFGVAYGLALQGLGLAQITSNLLPPEIAKQVVWRKKTPWFYGAAACLLLSAGIVWAVNFAEERAIEKATSGIPHMVNSVEDAYQVVENGPGADLSPKRYAEAVCDAGEKLRNALAQVENENAKREAEAREIARLQFNKTIWPKILDMIHSPLSALDPDLAKVLSQGPDVLKTLITSNQKKYERANRRQIVIRRLEAEYCPDVMSCYLDARRRKETQRTSFGKGRGGQTDSAVPLKAGFLVRLFLQTPNQGGFNFVNDEYLTKLDGAKADGVHLESPYVLDYWQVKYRGGHGGRPDGVPGPVSIGGSGADAMMVVADTDRDPVTEEPVQDDWEFEVILVAVLGDRGGDADEAGESPTPAPDLAAGG